MSFAPGDRLGPYEVIGPLGVGGMGEVFRARDTRLERTVAIKVLSADLAADPEFRQRFDREARSISALDHPNICALYDIGEHGGTSYLVMQYLEGETLAERIARGALPVPDAVRIAVDIAAALDAAHRSGIVHRDLKPGNIMLTKTGARLLDFGLAKSGSQTAGGAGGQSIEAPTMTSPLTAQGTILGTFQYMAPEQIEGEDADARTDIFAFGAVLYEMITGRRAFTGKTQASLIGAIMKDVPAPAGATSADVPPALDRVIARCLAKDPDDRWQTARDLKSELMWIVGEGRNVSGASPAVPPSPAPRSASTSPIAQVAALALVAVLASAVTWVLTRPAEVAAPHVEFSIPVPGDAPVRRDSGAGLAISPDGRFLVYVANPVGSQATMLYLRRLDSVGAQPIEGTEGGFAPFISPDSRWIGFLTDEHVFRLPVAGGRPTPITEKGPYSRAAWTADDRIVLGRSLTFAPGPLGIVPVAGGTAVPLTTLDDSNDLHQLPHPLPDGRHVLFSVHTEAGARIAVASLDDGTHRLIGLPGSDARYVEPGTLLFARDDALFEAPFDADQLEVTGPETAVLTDAYVFASGRGIAISLADADRAGTLAYLPVLSSQSRQLSWFEPTGRETPLALAPALYSAPRISPDGRRFVVGVNAGTGVRRIRVVDIAVACRSISTRTAAIRCGRRTARSRSSNSGTCSKSSIAGVSPACRPTTARHLRCFSSHPIRCSHRRTGRRMAAGCSSRRTSARRAVGCAIAISPCWCPGPERRRCSIRRPMNSAAGFRRTAAGWPISRRPPAARACTSGPSTHRVARRPSRAKAGTIRSGRATAARSTSSRTAR